MTRGNQRERDRKKAEARSSKSGGSQKKDDKPKVGGVNTDAEALKAKIEAKKKLKEEGKLEEKKPARAAKKKVANVTNPHTGKKDPKLTAKLVSKSKNKQK